MASEPRHTVTGEIELQRANKHGDSANPDRLLVDRPTRGCPEMQGFVYGGHEG